jgi:hypothetical protein
MKVILSRKGFDSENGGIPSAIMPNGDVVSFPIPSQNTSTFSDLRYGKSSYKNILDDLSVKFGYNEYPLSNCHIDPDLDKSRWRRPPHRWKPAFGPSCDVWHYLAETVGLGENDIFLFFGTFHFIEKNTFGKYEFSKGTGDFYHDYDLHLIWGYMQVGSIILDPEKTKKEYRWHPHAGGDILITPRKNLSFAPDKPGYGLLPFSPARVLTSKGKSKAYWKYNKVYSPENIIVAKGRKNSSRDPDCIYYSGIWQELGLKEGKRAENWSKRMILESAHV